VTDIIPISRVTRRTLLALAATAPIYDWAQGEPGAVAITLRKALQRVWLAYQAQKHIALDVVDVEAVLSGRSVLACCASGFGPERANMAAQCALSHFAESARVADGALVLVSAAAPHFKLWESRAAMNSVRAALPRRASVIYATLPGHRRDGRVEVTLLLAWQSQGICSIPTVELAHERSGAVLRKLPEA
jgi:cell division GTPase FtsZ